MTAPYLMPSIHTLAILDNIGCDTGRAIRKVSASEGPNTAWLRANADVARRAHASMQAEFRTDLDRERAVLASVGSERS